jgi:hypothetical protein
VQHLTPEHGAADRSHAPLPGPPRVHDETAAVLRPVVTRARPLRAGEALALQRRIGNGAMCRLLRTPAEQIDLGAIKAQLQKAMAGMGTDEEGIYRALQRIRGNQQAITELHRIYPSLMADLRDELDDDELELALQLLGSGTKGSAKEVAADKPAAPNELEDAARRLDKAMAGMGTDEEAIFAVLIPFRTRIRVLEDTYFRVFRRDLRTDVEDELGGSQLRYALELMEVPYEAYLREANERLRGIKFGVTLSDGCLPQNASDAYQAEYWEQTNPDGNKMCRLRLRPSKRPSEAVLAIIDDPASWLVDCLEFVTLAHWYARIKTQGAEKFDREMGTPFDLHPKGASTGLRSKRTFQRSTGDTTMMKECNVSDDGGCTERGPGKHVEAALAEAPIGSRVMWANPDAQANIDPDVQAYARENTIKLGRDRFGAFPLSKGILFWESYELTRDEIETRLAEIATKHSPLSAEQIRAKIFIQEIEEFDTPGASES